MNIDVFSKYNKVLAGFSEKPYKSNILRDEMVNSAKGSNEYVVRPCLVHGKDIICITKDMLKESPYIEIPDMDGLVTNIPGVTLTSTHGDCLPLYTYDPVKNVIGLAHAGWKGTALGIASSLIDAMKENYDCNPSDINAYIGPGIDVCHFEFSKDDAKSYFFDVNPWTKSYTKDSSLEGKIYLDLKGINSHFFSLSGVKDIKISPECTYCLDDKYYSYRRSKDMDRMLAYIKIEK